MTLSVPMVAAMLGVSQRKVYELAAPAGPIPCLRIGRRIIFDESDVQEFRQACRYTETRKLVRSSLNSTAVSVASESGLASAFRALGIKPKLTPMTGRKAPGSTH